MRRQLDVPGLGSRGTTVIAVPTPFAQTPDRQRKGWTFLTWAFFLPHLAASEMFFGKGAKGASPDEVHRQDDATPPTNGIDSIDGTPSVVLSDGESEAGPHLLGGSVSYGGPLISSTLLDVPSGSGASGFRGPAQDNDSKNSGGGGGGSASSGTGFGVKIGSDDAGEAVGNDSGASRYADLGANPREHSPGSPVVSPGSGDHNNPQLSGQGGGDSVSETPIVRPAPQISQPAPDAHDPSLGGGQLGSSPSPLPGLSADLPMLGIGVDAKTLLGFDINLSGDGLSIAADLDLGPLGDLLGLDVRVADGVLLGVDLGLPISLNPEPLVSGLTETVASALHATHAELTNILALDTQFGAAVLPDLLGAALNNSAIEGSSELIKTTLAEVTGVHIFSDLDAATQLPGKVLAATSEAVSATLDPISGHSDNGAVTSPLAHILTNVSDMNSLSQNGDVSIGNTINFSIETVRQTDELFAGQRYTDYNVTLQSDKSEPSSFGATIGHISGAAPEAVNTLIDLSSGNHDAAVQPVNDQTNDSSLVHASLSILHLSSH